MDRSLVMSFKTLHLLGVTRWVLWGSAATVLEHSGFG